MQVQASNLVILISSLQNVWVGAKKSIADKVIISSLRNAKSCIFDRQKLKLTVGEFGSGDSVSVNQMQYLNARSMSGAKWLTGVGCEQTREDQSGKHVERLMSRSGLRPSDYDSVAVIHTTEISLEATVITITYAVSAQASHQKTTNH